MNGGVLGLMLLLLLHALFSEGMVVGVSVYVCTQQPLLHVNTVHGCVDVIIT